MNRLTELLKSLNTIVLNVLSKIEESPFFEKIVLRWESLDPRYQKRYLAFGNLLGYVIVLGIVIYPIASVTLKRNERNLFSALQKQVRAVALSPEIVKQPAPPPQGWSPLNISTVEDFEINFENYMATLGVSFESGEFKRSSNIIQFEFEDLTIRQVFAMLYQLDGWYPGIRIKKFNIDNAKTNKVFLKVSAELEYDSVKAASFAGAGSGFTPGRFQNRGDTSGPSARFEPGTGMPNDLMQGEGRGGMTPPPMYDDELNGNGGDFNSNPPVPLAPFEDE